MQRVCVLWDADAGFWLKGVMSTHGQEKEACCVS